VFDIEPLPASHPFRTLDNVLATPHIGYVSARSLPDFYEDFRFKYRKSARHPTRRRKQPVLQKGRNERSLLLIDRPWQRLLDQLTAGETNDQARNERSFTTETNPLEIQPSCSLSLIDNLPEALKTLITRPLFVMRLDVRKLQIVGATPAGFRRVCVVPGGSFRGGAAFRRGVWMGGTTGRPYAPMAPRH